jgi:hypothetical protein
VKGEGVQTALEFLSELPIHYAVSSDELVLGELLAYCHHFKV